MNFDGYTCTPKLRKYGKVALDQWVKFAFDVIVPTELQGPITEYRKQYQQISKSIDHRVFN
jgi:hypothetical protein